MKSGFIKTRRWGPGRGIYAMAMSIGLSVRSFVCPSVCRLKRVHKTRCSQKLNNLELCRRPMGSPIWAFQRTHSWTHRLTFSGDLKVTFAMFFLFFVCFETQCRVFRSRLFSRPCLGTLKRRERKRRERKTRHQSAGVEIVRTEKSGNKEP